jgi:hypothetical protein
MFQYKIPVFKVEFVSILVCNYKQSFCDPVGIF